MNARAVLKRLARTCGFDVIRFSPRSSPVARRSKLFQYHRIDLVLDVGASTGGYGEELRATGYRGRIVSFEPSTAAFCELLERTSRDRHWDAVQVALGQAAGRATLRLSRNRESSSFLQINRRHTAAYPDAAYIGSEVVPVDTLDAVYARHLGEATRVFLKIDTQGFEQQVLLGAETSLSQITGVQLELSLVALYDQEPAFMELITHLQSRGFTLMSLQPVIDDPATGQLLQVDGLFFRT